MKKLQKLRDLIPGSKLTADEVDQELIKRVIGEDFMTFLQAVGQGCISGNVTEWPQLKPACAWAYTQINQLLVENNQIKLEK